MQRVHIGFARVGARARGTYRVGGGACVSLSSRYPVPVKDITNP